MLILLVVVLIGGGIFWGGYYFNSDRGSGDTQEVVEEDEENKNLLDDVEKTTTTVIQPKKTVVTESVIIIPSGRLTVIYTNSGFSPTILEVRAGQPIDFINKSNGTLWVTANFHPILKDQRYSEFDSGKSIPSGGIYSFTPTLIGFWGYKNLNNDNHLGSITVLPQQ